MHRGKAIWIYLSFGSADDYSNEASIGGGPATLDTVRTRRFCLGRNWHKRYWSQLLRLRDQSLVFSHFILILLFVQPPESEFWNLHNRYLRLSTLVLDSESLNSTPVLAQYMP
jgi:hypothetical protein